MSRVCVRPQFVCVFIIGEIVVVFLFKIGSARARACIVVGLLSERIRFMIVRLRCSKSQSRVTHIRNATHFT